MRYLKVSALLACSAALVVTSGCNDMPAPLEPEPIELDLQVQRAPGSGEICWWVGSGPPDYKRHVVSWQQSFEGSHGYRFREPLPDAGFFPGDPPLVAHVLRLYKPGSFSSANRVGTGYMVSVVGEKEGRATYPMYHQIVFQPWMGPEEDPDPCYVERKYYYNEGLCTDTNDVFVCTEYACDVCESWVNVAEDDDEPDWKCTKCSVPSVDEELGHSKCVRWVERPACVGTVLGTSSMNCNNLPCTNNLHTVEVDFQDETWYGFGDFKWAGMHHGRGGELRQGEGEFSAYALLYGWHHGEICVTFDPQLPDPEPTGPMASFRFDCDGLTCTFTDTSEEGDAAISSWSWDFGSNGEGSGETVVHTYGDYGTYTVTLTVTDEDELYDTAKKDVNVTDPEDPEDPDDPEPGDPSIDQFDLTNTSNPQFARVRVDWEVSGDNLKTVTLEITGPNTDSQTWNVSGSEASGQHEFSFRRGFGTYTVTLTVIDGEGNEESEDKTIQL